MTASLTERQRRVYRAIGDHYARHGLPPTIRELCDVLGIASPNGVVNHLLRLAAKGVIRFRGAAGGSAASSRGIEVVGLHERITAAAREFFREG